MNFSLKTGFLVHEPIRTMLQTLARGCRCLLGPSRQLTSLLNLRRFASDQSGVGLSEEQLSFKHVADEFAQNELIPFAAGWDETHHFPVETMRAAAALGFGAIYVSDAGGGP